MILFILLLFFISLLDYNECYVMNISLLIIITNSLLLLFSRARPLIIDNFSRMGITVITFTNYCLLLITIIIYI
jgi:hypothetical protein